METPPKQTKTPHSSQTSSQKDKSSARGSGGGGSGGGGGGSGGNTAVTGGEFIVAKILGKKITRYEAQYHVKWEGYSMAEATWEPYSNLQHNVVRARFDDRLKQWLRKHDEAGTASRVSDVDREIAEWTAKQAALKLKHAKNNEELRADRVDQEWREFSKTAARQSSQHLPESAVNQSTPAAAADSGQTQRDLVASQQFSSKLSSVAIKSVGAPTNGSITPTPTGIPTPMGNPGTLLAPQGGAMTPGSAGGKTPSGGSFNRQRSKRTSPYPEWVAVARKRLLTEKRNVLKIYSLSSINDVPCYKVQLDGLREPEYIPTVLVKQHHPSRVIEFYEDHLTVPSPSKNGKRIKLKDLFAEMQQQQQLQQQQPQQSEPTNPPSTTTQSTNNELEANDQHMPAPRSQPDGDDGASQVTTNDAKSTVSPTSMMNTLSPARPLAE